VKEGSKRGKMEELHNEFIICTINNVLILSDEGSQKCGECNKHKENRQRIYNFKS
jgi:hypothetical protein